VPFSAEEKIDLLAFLQKKLIVLWVTIATFFDSLFLAEFIIVF
jgi:hypothetical protein